MHWRHSDSGALAGRVQHKDDGDNSVLTVHPAGCADVPPSGSFTCGQQAAWGKCGADFMIAGGFCAATCGRCGGGAPGNAVRVTADPGAHRCGQPGSCCIVLCCRALCCAPRSRHAVV